MKPHVDHPLARTAADRTTGRARDRSAAGAALGVALLCGLLVSLGIAPRAAAGEKQSVLIDVRTPSAVASRAATPGKRKSPRERVSAEILAREGGAAARAASAGPVIVHEYAHVWEGFAANLETETVQALLEHPDVARIVPDGVVHTQLEATVPLVGAPQVWNELGYRAEGVRIAIVDTGVDYTHGDLGGCFGVGCKVVGGYDFVNGDHDPMDDDGHGTHVAAIAAGVGPHAGVAPGATLLAYKVLDANGSGRTSDVLAGIEAAVDPDGDGDPSDRVDVLNLSLGGLGDENDPLSSAVDAATAYGVLSVVAAGNLGSGYRSVGSPAVARSALTVGASDGSDEIAPFSSRGPSPREFQLKPEIVAPGVSVCAASIAGSDPSAACGTGRFALSGTSMATPHVAGAAAIVRGLAPDLEPGEVKALLQHAAAPVPGDAVSAGAGRLDVYVALATSTVVTPNPLNLGEIDRGVATWSESVTLTVRNLADTDQQYAMRAQGFPAGVSVTFDTNPVTVAPGEARAVRVVFSASTDEVPDSDVPPHLHTGRIAAQSDTEAVSVRVGFAKRGPADREQPTEEYWGYLDLDDRSVTYAPHPDGGYTVCSDHAPQLPVDPSRAHTLALGDDDYAAIELQRGRVPFAGDLHSTVYVGSNGYVTFGIGDTNFSPDLDAHFRAPRVSALFADLNPGAGGTVLWEELPGRVVVSWIDVPHYGSDESHTFQLELFYDGRIRTTFTDVVTPVALSGLSRGEGTPAQFRQADLSATRACGGGSASTDLIAARRLVLTDAARRGGQSRISFRTHRASEVAAPGVGTSQDPTLHGARFEVYDPTSGEHRSFELPAGGWSVLPNHRTGVQYRYRDPDERFGPCRRAKIQDGQRIGIDCRGPSAGFRLDEPLREAIVVRLATGAPSMSHTYCAVFGGTVRANRAASPKRRGRFLAYDAPRPDACPDP